MFSAPVLETSFVMLLFGNEGSSSWRASYSVKRYGLAQLRTTLSHFDVVVYGFSLSPNFTSHVKDI